jgi:hypothetical protein
MAELNAPVNASPSLMARERQIVANYTDALTALLAEDGAAPDAIEPRIAAEAMIAFHRSLIELRPSTSLRGADLAAEIRAAGEHALTLLEGGSASTAGAPHRPPLTTILTRRGMRKDVREFARRLEAVGLTVESTPGHYRVLRDGKPLRKANGMPFTLPFSPDTIRWRRAAIVELRKLGIDL